MTIFPQSLRWVYRPETTHQKWAACALLTALLLLIFSGFSFLLFTGMKSSGAYKLTLRTVQEHPQIIETLGAPLEPSWWLLGCIERSAARGSASLEFAVEGSKAGGDVYSLSAYRLGEWHLVGATFVFEDGRQLDLLAKQE